MKCTCGHPDNYNYAIDNGLCNSCIEEKLEQLEAEIQKYRWIPVEERLPKDEYSLLAYGEDGFGYRIVANTSYNCEFKKFRILSKVTHWKPIILPEQALKGIEP